MAYVAPHGKATRKCTAFDVNRTWIHYHLAFFVWSYIYCFDTIPACDRQTDIQTHDDGIYRVSIASHNKNYHVFTPNI